MPVHLGILGGGNISRTHLLAAREIEGLRVTAVCGGNEQSVRELAAGCSARPYGQLDAFLSHRPLDVVAIGSPSGLHAEQGIEAARRGLHVLVEKPIDITTDRADALIAACESAGVKLGVFFQDRVSDGVLRLKAVIDSGRLGRLLSASAQVRWYRPPEYYATSRWRGTWRLDGGGALMNQGIHTVDLLLWLAGGVRRVQALVKTAWHRMEAEDLAVAILELEGGALATLEATTAAYPGFPRRLVLTGSEGTAVLEHDALISLDLKGNESPAGPDPGSNLNPSARSPVVSDVRGHRRILEDFLESIRSGRQPVCDGREARRSVELIEAIYQSARSGQAVFLKS